MAVCIRTIGVGFEFQDDILLYFFLAVNQQSDAVECVDQQGNRDVQIDVVFEPIDADSHFCENCLMNLKSFS